MHRPASETTYTVLLSFLTKADLVHDIGVMYHSAVISPEMMFLTNEIIDMVKVLKRGIEFNDETLALDLIERLGPGANYLMEKHTLKHYKRFWTPKIFDRSVSKDKGEKTCSELLKQQTIETLKKSTGQNFA